MSIFRSAIMGPALLLALLGGTSPARAASLAVTDTSVTEGNTTANAVFTIKLSEASTQTVTVQYATADFTALAGVDYTAKALTTLTFSPGQISKTVSVAVTGDTIDEADEKFLLKLSASTNATIADSSGIATIVDDDTSVISAAGASYTEGNTGTSPLNFTLKLSKPNSRTVTVKAQTVAGPAPSATAGTDYTAQTKTITFPAGTTTQVMTVEIKTDLLDEDSEKVGLLLSAPTNASLGAVTPGTIVDDDATPALSITDATVTEGNTGSINAAFKVNLSAASGRTVTVKYATADVSTTAGADYTALPLTTLTFTAGQTSKNVYVAVKGDKIDEANETFSVVLSAATNATLADATGTGAITDDDTSTVSAVGSTVTEGNSGTVPMTFTVKLSTPNSRVVKVKVQTVDSTIDPATPGADYTALAPVIVTFPAGETAQSLTVDVKGDLLDETQERVALQLSGAVNAALGANGQGFIADDDALPEMSVFGDIVTEGYTGETTTAAIQIQLSAPSGRKVSCQLSTTDDTATAGSDYLAIAPTTIYFAPGQTTRILGVTVYGDSVPEANEKLKVVITNNQYSTLVQGTGTVTIRNDDNTEPVAFDDVYHDETAYVAGDTLDLYLRVLDNDYDADGDLCYVSDAVVVSGDYAEDEVEFGLYQNDGIGVTIPNLRAGSSHVQFDYHMTDFGDSGGDDARVDLYFEVSPSGGVKILPKSSVRRSSGKSF